MQKVTGNRAKLYSEALNNFKRVSAAGIECCVKKVIRVIYDRK